MSVTYDFKEQVALVGGAASGMRLASALASANAVARVALADVSEGPLQNAVDEIRPLGGDAIGLPYDMCDGSQVLPQEARPANRRGPQRSEQRGVGKECGSTRRYRWWPEI